MLRFMPLILRTEISYICFVFILAAPWANITPEASPITAVEICRNVSNCKMAPNVELTGAARLYRAASSDRRERG